MKEKQPAPTTGDQWWTMQFYFGIVVLSNIVIKSLSLISFIAPHRRQCKVLFSYPLINLSNKKTMQNRYGTCELTDNHHR